MNLFYNVAVTMDDRQPAPAARRVEGVTIPALDGATIRAKRKERGWTQEQLANVLGLRRETIGLWEREAVPLTRLAAWALVHVLRIKPRKRARAPKA